MKKLLFLGCMFFALSTSLVLTGCGDDEEEATCTDGIQNGNETGIDCGGDCSPCPTCDDGIMNGEEEGIDCGGPDCDPCLVGLQGAWQSSGDNVAPLLVTLFATDSIWAEFRTDFTYTVHQFDDTGAQLTLEGVYTQSESDVAGIWDITVNQSSPASLTSTGIFSITDDVMLYEIVQTLPDIGAVPPTPAGGFGSTSGGLFGMTNVQTYIRLE